MPSRADNKPLHIRPGAERERLMALTQQFDRSQSLIIRYLIRYGSENPHIFPDEWHPRGGAPTSPDTQTHRLHTLRELAQVIAHAATLGRTISRAPWSGERLDRFVCQSLEGLRAAISAVMRHHQSKPD